MTPRHLAATALALLHRLLPDRCDRCRAWGVGRVDEGDGYVCRPCKGEIAA